MRVMLAPMEGVVDHRMRGILTAIGGYHSCVSEFIRVTDQPLPKKVFHRIAPELNDGGSTLSGTPVVIQLLGGHPETMAINARKAADLGAPAIDINFGCPSRLVNRKAGGAVLLKDPTRLYAIVKAVRLAVAAHIPVTAKLRLGYENTDLAVDNALAVQEAGADSITVHARTRLDGYSAPARWEWLARINENTAIPVVANGDINSVEDYLRCRQISGCDDIMIGRGAITKPDLAKQIRCHQQGVDYEPMGWDDIRPLLLQMGTSMEDDVKDRHIGMRIKQWLVYLKRDYMEAQHCFSRIRRITGFSAMKTIL
ncbi:MAG: tRNA-dihydrouridine synthase [Candidatus Polarisedimenticolaceae bacterium]|nr:tRNA-dihydrouridine synthase [Candidatus Polarisedimenticolaceae bacterium]